MELTEPQRRRQAMLLRRYPLFLPPHFHKRLCTQRTTFALTELSGRKEERFGSPGNVIAGTLWRIWQTGGIQEARRGYC